MNQLLVETIPNSISIFACLWLFYIYVKVTNRTIGLLMILTLSISDIVFHISTFFNNPCSTCSQPTIVYIITNTFLKFSMFWATNISFFLYRMLNQNANPQRYYFVSLITLLTFALSLTIVCRIFHSDFTTTDVVVMVISLPLSFALMVFFYLKSVPKLKKLLSFSTDQSTKTLYMYAFVQLFTVCPIIVYSLVHYFTQAEYPIAESITYLLIGFSGFSNSLVYFFQRLNTEGSIQETSSSFQSELSRTNSIEKALYIGTSV